MERIKKRSRCTVDPAVLHALGREALHSGRVHPYRDPASGRCHGEDGRAPFEEWAVAGLLAVVGGARVVIAIARGESAAADVTVAGILALIGVLLFGRLARTVDL